MAGLSAVPGRVIGRLLTPKEKKNGKSVVKKKRDGARGKSTVKINVSKKPAIGGAAGKARGAAIPGRVLGKLRENGKKDFGGLGEKPKVEIRVPSAGKYAGVKVVAKGRVAIPTKIATAKPPRAKKPKGKGSALSLKRKPSVPAKRKTEKKVPIVKRKISVPPKAKKEIEIPSAPSPAGSAGAPPFGLAAPSLKGGAVPLHLPGQRAGTAEPKDTSAAGHGGKMPAPKPAVVAGEAPSSFAGKIASAMEDIKNSLKDEGKRSMDVSGVARSLKEGETAAIKTDGGHSKVRTALKELLESPDTRGGKRPNLKGTPVVKAKAKKPALTIERIKSGVKGLDKLIEGGFERGSAVLVVGSAGSGKTLFCLQYLYYGALRDNEPGIFISFEEDRASLIRHSSAFGWDFEALEKKNLFRILEYRPHQAEKLVTQGGGPIKDAIREMGATRLAMDSVTAYSLLFREEYQRRESIIRLIDMLKSWGVTSLLISELPPKVAEIKEGSIGFLTDAVISLYYSKKSDSAVRVHSCEILKMRGTKHTNKLLAIGFEKDGMAVYPEVEVF